MKFTFKTHQPTGKYRSFYSPFHDIKYKKAVIGQINNSFPHFIRLMVIKINIMEDNNPNCIWKWIRLSKKSNSISEAKEYLNNNISTILTKFNIYMSND